MPNVWHSQSSGMSPKMKKIGEYRDHEKVHEMKWKIKNSKATSTWFEVIVLKEAISQILTILLIENPKLNAACKSAWKWFGPLQVCQIPASNTDGKLHHPIGF